jgi:hypothetical protein
MMTSNPDDRQAGQKTVGSRTIAIASAVAAFVAAVAAFSGNLLSIRDGLRKMFGGAPAAPVELVVKDVRLAFHTPPDMLVLELSLDKKGDAPATGCKAQLDLDDGIEHLSRDGPSPSPATRDFAAGPSGNLILYAFSIPMDIDVVGRPFRVRCGELGHVTAHSEWKAIARSRRLP